MKKKLNSASILLRRVPSREAAERGPIERPLERLEKPSDFPSERVIKDLTKPKPPPLAKKVAKPKAVEPRASRVI